MMIKRNGWVWNSEVAIFEEGGKKEELSGHIVLKERKLLLGWNTILAFAPGCW